MNDQELTQLEQKVDALEKKLLALQSNEPKALEAAQKNDFETIEEIASQRRHATYILYIFIALMLLGSLVSFFKKPGDIELIMAKRQEELKHESK